jgi:putative ABC transport system permease protein
VPELIRYLLRHKARTALTVLAIAVGVFAVTAVGGIAEYLDVLVVRPAVENARGRVRVAPKQWEQPLTLGSLRQLRRIEGVAGVTATISDRIEEREGFQFRPQAFAGTRSDIPGLEYEPPMGAGLWAGRVPEPGSRAETVVSWDLAQAHGLEVGDVLVIRERPFRVVGIWERVEAEEHSMAFISYDMAERLATDRWYSYPGVGQVTVIPRPGVDSEALADRIRAALDDAEVQSPQEAVQEARQVVLIFSLIVGASGVMALLIGAFTVVNTMAVSVHERRREIGLKKALGAADSHVLAEFVAEAACVGGLGGSLGLVAGWAVGLVANRIALEQLGTRVFLLTPRLAVGALVLTVLMGSIAGLYPAWRAARLDPVVALRGSGGAACARRGLRRLIALIRRNARSILTVGGIAIGIFALVVLGSLAEYLNGYLDDVVEGAQHKVYVRPEDADVPFGRSTARIVRRTPGVRDVVLTRWGGFLDEEDTGGLGERSFYGIESPTGEFGWEIPVEVRFAQGRNLNPGSLHEAVVGAGLAKDLDLQPDSTIVIRDREFTVVGIRERIPRDLGELDYTVHITLEALARVLGRPDPARRVTALVAPGHDAQEVARAIETALPGIETMTTADQADEVRQVLAILFAVMAGLFSIAVFVGSVSVTNTMVIAIHRRTGEIGLKKAVGAGDADILAEVLVDAGKLGGLGGGLGVLVAWPVTAGINLYAQSAGGFTILELTPRLAVGAVVFSTLLGMLAGLLPAWRAAHLDPVVALRTE